LRRFSTQSRQNVDSNVQIIALVADGGKSMSQHSQLGRSSSIQTPSTETISSRPLSRYGTERDVVHLLGFGGAGGQQEAEIGPGRDVACAHAHEFGGELRPRCQPADADMLAVLATGGNGPGIGIAQAWMFVLAGKAPVGQEIIRADHDQVDAFDRGDRVSLAQGLLAFKLDDEQRRRVERRVRRCGRKAPVMQMGQGSCCRTLPERREFCRLDIAACVVGRLHMRCNHAKRASIEHPRHLGDARHANERCNPCLERGDADLAGSIEREAGMLQIDIEAVEAGRLGDAGDLNSPMSRTVIEATTSPLPSFSLTWLRNSSLISLGIVAIT